jgi:hypothetical protein
MNCWHCERPANGTCRFCGRALCKGHAESMPHIEAIFKGEGGAMKALVVADALYCGICQPGDDPIELPDLD